MENNYDAEVRNEQIRIIFVFVVFLFKFVFRVRILFVFISYFQIVWLVLGIRLELKISKLWLCSRMSEHLMNSYHESSTVGGYPGLMSGLLSACGKRVSSLLKLANDMRIMSRAVVATGGG